MSIAGQNGADVLPFAPGDANFATMTTWHFGARARSAAAFRLIVPTATPLGPVSATSH